MMHQDSNASATGKLCGLEYLHALDFGQDTDFETARLFPKAEVNCILFPAWIESHPMDEVRGELTRLMELGKNFAAFSFTLLEIDTNIGGDLLFEFHETFRESTMRSDRGTNSVAR